MDAVPTISFEDTSVAFSYKSDAALKKANFIFSLINHPWISAVAVNAVKMALTLKLPVESIIRKTVFSQFCGGESIEESKNTITQIGNYGVRTILDYSVEGEKSEAGFDATMNEIIRTIETAHLSKNIPFSVFKVTGIASAELLEKIQKKTSLSEGELQAFQRIKERVNNICAKAHAYMLPVLIDAEETWIQNSIDALAYEMMEKYNKQRAIVFNTFQFYRVASPKNLRDAYHNATMHDYYLGAKLVRGAYMEKERERAKDFNYPSPIFENKDTTDQAFNEALRFCINHKQRIAVMCGSHNEYSNYYLTVLMEKHSMANNDSRVWFSQLLGMSDNISFNLATAGYNVAKYVPYGPVRSVMPYLFRRAEENTSVAGQSSRELTLIQKEIKRRRSASRK
ncbi:proline dehydrogenase family protein [Chryseolinea sp. H1M3-3]|uniref:proline dehydrogenase family protein n=1 Tax=Chryseolinea sp. H1M3-3 TaxID=3034144 RepID=UPI0023EDF574|nr:proline dehydrogenase family protein [Chryseolinea sp. H1M3-3]